MNLIYTVSRELGKPFLRRLRILLNQLDLTSLLLFNLEFSVTLADNPSVIKLSTWACIVEERHKAPLALTDARSVIT